MNHSDFHAPQAGRVVITAQGYTAFVPAPLPPPDLSYDSALVLVLSRADTALSELAGLGRVLPNPYLLIAPYLRREAVLSSRIEGTRTNLAELLREEAVGRVSPTPDAQNATQINDLQEVRNYVRSLEKGIARLKELPLSLRLVRELHEELMRGVRGDFATPGEFRRSQNWIGPAGCTLADAPYVPPPVAEMMDCLSDWERFINERDSVPVLIQCALMHEQFEAIHPFLDGNGRVGRLLITLFLIERGRIDQPLLYLSEYIEANRADYYRALQQVRTQGDWRNWLLYFLTGVENTARRAVAQARQLMDLRESLRHTLQNRARALALLDSLFVNPYITVRGTAEILGVSNPTARQAVAELVEAGVLESETERNWGKLYVARPILSILAE